jgi:hypothetical protein
VGVYLVPHFNKKVPAADSFDGTADGRFFASYAHLLEDISQEKGVTPFYTFAPDPDTFEELAKKLKPGEVLEWWFSCTDGLKTIRAAVEALQTEKKWRKALYRKSDGEHLVGCLQRLEKDLTTAKQKRAKFCMIYS